MIPEIPRFLPSFFRQQIIHIGGQTADELHTQILTVVLNVPVGGHIIKVLGCSDLACKLSFKIHAALLHQLNEPMDLAGRDKGVHGIGKQHRIATFQ